MGTLRDYRDQQQKMIPSLRYLTCQGRLERLYLLSLAESGERQDLITMYRVMKGIEINRDGMYTWGTEETKD